MKRTAGVGFIRNHISNRVFESVKRPTYAYIAITSLCNSRCSYCDAWKNRPESGPETDQWKEIIDDLVALGVVTLTFSGGEPFLHNDLLELASYARSRGLVTMVVTNLSLFKESHIEKIAESVDFLGISLDSTRAEVYQAVRGVDWLERIKENVRTLMAGLTELKADVQVCGMVTITNKNAWELHDVIHMIFDDLGMDTVSFNVLDPNGGATARELAPTPEQIDHCKKVISAHKSRYPISNSARFIARMGALEYRCNPWKSVQIDEKGRLQSPCLFGSSRPDLFPDARETDLCTTSLSDAWREDQAIYSRYAGCKLCSLGCVVESAWSTYDLKFVIADSFFGSIYPTMRRIGERNGGRRPSR